jgi:hypothetical protein
MAKGNWGWDAGDNPPGPGNNDWDKMASLAWLIIQEHVGQNNVQGKNPYKTARPLEDGSQNGELWRHTVQGSNILEGWKHDGNTYAVVRSARIPYLVHDTRSGAGTIASNGNRKEWALEHLLAGIALPVPDPTVPTPANPLTWNAGGPPGNSPLERLGQFLVEDLRPVDVAEMFRVAGWQNAIGEDQPGSLPYPNPNAAARFWNFRGAPHHVEKSLLVPMLAKYSVTNIFKNRYLLVGYEGGAGW